MIPDLNLVALKMAPGSGQPILEEFKLMISTCEAESMTQESLSQIRDTLSASSRNTSKGALLKETFAVFRAVKEGLPLGDVRQAITNGKVFQKASYETRRKIRDAIFHRYLAICPDWIGFALAKSTEKGSQSPEFLSLAYLYFALRDRLVFDFITGLVWDKWSKGDSVIGRADFFAFLEYQAGEFSKIKQWRESTRDRLASSDLSALRDFGLLQGKQKKYIQKPTVTPETVYHLLCLLIAEGREGKSIFDAPDWRLFLWTEAEVVTALSDLAQRKWINFEKSGRTVILNLVRYPEIEE